MSVYIVQGMAFGDEGKGCTVDALVRRVNSDLVVRFNGGAQAAHNVITKEGQHHTFAQWGSGTFVPGVATYLSRFVLINPLSMNTEASELMSKGVKDVWDRMFLSPLCPVITPFHRAFNRITEICRGQNRHGSTGMGIGETRYIHLHHQAIGLVAGMLQNPEATRRVLRYQRAHYKELIKGINRGDANLNRELDSINSDTIIDWYVQEYEKWAQKVCFRTCIPDGNNPVFEGAQGVLLDETHGFQPHTTWTDCTFKNADTLLDEDYSTDRRIRIGVWRCYFTRHGAGPLPSELDKHDLSEQHNKAEQYTGHFRVGTFDLPLALYAHHTVGRLDGFVVNHFDRFAGRDIPVRISRSQTIHVNRAYFIDMLEDVLRVPLVGQGDGPTSEDKSIDLGAIDAKANHDVGPVGIGQVHYC